MRRAVWVALLPVALALASTGYHVIKEIRIGGDGGWDYLTIDPVSRRLYVAHASQVAIVDADAGTRVGDIPDTPGVHGIAIAAELNRGFVSNGRSNNVTIFDLKTLKTLGQAKAGENPDAIGYDRVSGRVFAFNGRSQDATAIDAKTGGIAGTIPLGGKPEYAVTDGQGKIYVNIEDTGEIAEIDTAKLAVTKRYPLKPCEDPTGLAMDVKNRRLFSVCSNRVMVVSDPDSGKILATPPIGAGADGCAFDPETGEAFSSNGDGTLTVVQQRSGKWEVVETIATVHGARTITFDQKTHRLFLPAAEPAPSQGRQRAGYIPDSFKVLVVGK